MTWRVNVNPQKQNCAPKFSMNHILLALAFVLCANFLDADRAVAWTHLCPQEHLNELCKCSPGEQCCFCPKPRAAIGHGHVAEGLLENLSNPGSPDNPCSSIVIPNGCTLGGTCPSCNGVRREFTSDLCFDEPSCPRIGLTRTICSTFADIRSR